MDNLTEAIEDGDLNLVKKYANKKNINRKKNPPLILASKEGLKGIVEFLIDSGANINAKNDGALRSASRKGHNETVKLLLDHGANVNAKNDEALREASWGGYTETVKLLIDKGANVNANDDASLQWAAQNSHTETVKLLLEHGAKTNAVTDKKSQDLIASIILEIEQKKEQEKQEKLRQSLSGKNLPTNTEDLIPSIKEAIFLNLKDIALPYLAKLPQEEIAQLAKDSNCSGLSSKIGKRFLLI